MSITSDPVPPTELIAVARWVLVRRKQAEPIPIVESERGRLPREEVELLNPVNMKACEAFVGKFEATRVNGVPSIGAFCAVSVGMPLLPKQPFP